MAESNSNHEENAEPQNAAGGQVKPQETPQGGGLPGVSDTVKHVRSLWEKAVPPDASPGASIKAGGIGAGLEAASKLLPRLRRLSKAKEEKEKPEESDFELIELLGKGGMGMVFLARQKSLDREVAVKVIQPKAAGDAEARGKFFAEALVTGELDHPNIVPVYDFGGTPEGVLFYPMKQVRGTSWDKVIEQKSLDDNLSVLLSVCDAVAFAHDKGVIHRDLKPENVMLGDYGEVFVMDWGLAASVGMEKAEKLTPETGFAGTPAYMAPEMAKCEPTKIGPTSDIYLLGGILYEIVTGLRPHTGDEVYSWIHAAMENVIQPTEKKGELVEIALKAMATEPQERHKSVKNFQRVVREYRSHAESLKLSAAAEERLSAVKEKPKTEVYRECTETIAGYQQAIELWSHNEAAITGLRKARETFVEVALERGDLALAQSQVAAMEEECGKFVLPEKRLEGPKALAEKVSLAIARAARKEKIARLSRRAALAAASLVLIVSLTAYFITKLQRDRAIRAERGEARQRRAAERENYYNIIALADAQIANREIAQAEALLWSAPKRLRHWEWGRLMRACHQELFTLGSFGGEVQSVAFSSDGRRLMAVDQNTARVWDTESGRQVLTLKGVYQAAIFSPDGKRIAGGYGRPPQSANSLAFSPDGRRMITGTLMSMGGVSEGLWDAETGREISRLGKSFSPCTIWEAETGREILGLERSETACSVAFSPDGRRVVTAGGTSEAHVWDAETGRKILTLQHGRDLVTSAAFSPDGKRMATGGSDSTAKLWDAEDGSEVLTLRGHSGVVVSVVFSPDGKRLMTESRDNTARVWDVESGQEIVTLTGHRQWVRCAAFSPDGMWAVTGGDDGRVMVWNAQANPLLTVRGRPAPKEADFPRPGCVRSLTFSPHGRRLAAITDDGTASIWNADDGKELLRLEIQPKSPVFGDGSCEVIGVCS